MGKPRMTPLAIALRAIEPLSDEEKQTLRDVLRPTPKPRQKAGAAKCRLCHKTATAATHTVGHDRYEHPFESSIATLKSTERKPSQKRKAGKDTTANHSALDGRGCAWKGCGRFLDDNVHQLETWTDYHEFVEPAGEAKGASG